jgi:hypothetical protein
MRDPEKRYPALDRKDRFPLRATRLRKSSSVQVLSATCEIRGAKRQRAPSAHSDEWTRRRASITPVIVGIAFSSLFGVRKHCAGSFSRRTTTGCGTSLSRSSGKGAMLMLIHHRGCFCTNICPSSTCIPSITRSKFITSIWITYNILHICYRKFLAEITRDCHKFLYHPKCNSQIRSGFASLVLNERGRSRKEAHEDQSAHG